MIATIKVGEIECGVTNWNIDVQRANPKHTTFDASATDISIGIDFSAEYKLYARLVSEMDRLQKLRVTFPPQPVWVFPQDRFVEYEAKDEAWARPLGLGREQMRRTEIVLPNTIIKRVGQNSLTLQSTGSTLAEII